VFAAAFARRRFSRAVVHSAGCTRTNAGGGLSIEQECKGFLVQPNAAGGLVRKQPSRRVWPGAFRGSESVRRFRACGRLVQGARLSRLCAPRGSGLVRRSCERVQYGVRVRQCSRCCCRQAKCRQPDAAVHAHAPQPNPPFEGTTFRTRPRGGLAHVPPRGRVLQVAPQLDVRPSSYRRFVLRDIRSPHAGNFWAAMYASAPYLTVLCAISENSSTFTSKASTRSLKL
jgi:hypothetical protein